MTKIIRFLAFVLVATLLCLSAVGCGDGDVTTTIDPNASQTPTYQGKTIRAYAIKGPTGMSMASLMAGNGNPVFDYQFELKDAPDKVAPEIIKGNYDLAALPTNLAATLYQKTNGDFQVIALNTLGVLYLMENGNTINSLADLDGKTVYYFGQASTPQYILDYLFEKSNINVTLEAVTDQGLLANELASNSKAIAVLPEPAVSTAMTLAKKNNNTTLRVAMDLTEEWQKVSENTSPVQGCLVARKAFLQEIGKEGLQALLTELSASATFVKTDASAPSVLAAQEIVGSQSMTTAAKEALAKNAIANLGDNLCFITGNEMKTQLSVFLTVLYNANPQSVGDALPNDEFYAIP